MNMHDYVRICRRRWASILLTLLIALAAAAVIYPFQPTTYAATTKIYVSAASGENLEELQQGSDFAEQRAGTYADLVTTPAVLGPVIEELRLPMASSRLAEDIDAEALGGTTLLEITASADTAAAAADIANSTVTSLQELVNEIDRPVSGAASDAVPLVELAVVQEAEVPTRPVSPRLEVTLGIGLAVGLVLGLGLAFLREALDTAVRTPRDLKDLVEAPLLGVIRRSRASSGNRQRSAPGPAECAASFREVRMRLMFGETHGSPSSYVVTSSLEREGRTTVALNLARSLVEGGRRTLLIGADFADPDLVQQLRAGRSQRGQIRDLTPTGLTEVLSGKAYLEDVILRDAEPGLDVVPAGRRTDQRLEATRLDSMAGMLETCAETYDVTIIDTSALLSSSDAALLGQITTGVIVVARYGEVTRAQLSTGLDLLARARARIVGVVFTGVPRRGPDRLHDAHPPTSRRRRSARGPAEVEAPESDPQAHSQRPGHSAARRRWLPDGTLALSQSTPRAASSLGLPQDRG